MADMDKALAFVIREGGPLGRARLDCILNGKPPSKQLIVTLLEGQRPGGGWAPGWLQNSDRSGIDATCFRLAQAEQVGLVAPHPAIVKAIRYLFRQQRPEGFWEEEVPLGSVPPPWAMPGDGPSRLYLTANAGLWVAAVAGPGGSAARASRYLLRHFDDEGRAPSFLHTHWLAAALFWKTGQREAAERVLHCLRSRLPDLPASNMAWLVTSLALAGVPVAHPLLQAAAALLDREQQEDGRWVSEDGSEWDLHSTLEALRALRLCGRLGTPPEAHAARGPWLRERRVIGEQRMDEIFAPVYDENWGATIDPTHRRMLERLLQRLEPRATILDAPCGTGKYWPLLLARGCSVVGVDWSRGMLEKAHAKHPDVPVVKLSLQELNEDGAFDACICVDAMENIPPEEWPLVLGNLRRALKPAGLLYLTVELAEENQIQAAFAAGRRAGLPVVPGEWAHEGGYHYYPSIDLVHLWLEDAGFEVLEETLGDGYYHVTVSCRQ